MSSHEGVVRWLRLVARHGFCIVTDTPPTAAATEALARRVGYVRETIFGGFWEFTADLAKADTAYTNLELRPHTDGTYSHDAPGLQMLHCLEFDGEGGESTMVDGFRLARDLREKRPPLPHGGFSWRTSNWQRNPARSRASPSVTKAATPLLRIAPAARSPITAVPV